MDEGRAFIKVAARKRKCSESGSIDQMPLWMSCRKKIARPNDLRGWHFKFPNLPLKYARHFGDAPATLRNVWRVEISLQERSSSRMRPLSPVLFILEMMASK